MNKNILILLIIILLCSNIALGLTVKSQEGKFQVNMPDVVSRLEPVEIKIQTKKLDANYMKIGGDCYFLDGIVAEEDKKMLPPIGTRRYNKYDGEKEFSVTIGVDPFKDSSRERECDIGFIDREDKDDSFTWKRSVDSVDWDFKVTDSKTIHKIPIQLKDSSVPDEVYIFADQLDPNSYHVSITQHTYPYSIDVLYSDRIDESYNKIWEKTDNYHNDYEEILSQGRKTLYYIDSGHSGKSGYDPEDEGMSYVYAELSAIRFYPHFYIKFEIEKRNDVADEVAAQTEQEYREEISSIVKDFKISESGATSASGDFIDEEEIAGACSTDSDCGDSGLVCTACSECKKPDSIVSPEDVEVEIELENDITSKSIYNHVRHRVRVDTTIDPTFTADGKKIAYCDIAAPGLQDYKIVGKIKEGFEFAGFTTGIKIFEERKQKFEWDVDFTKKPLKYPFLISPNDNKKVHGVLGDVNVELEIEIEGFEKTTENIVLKPIRFELDIKSKGQQVHQDSNKLIRFDVKNPYAKHIFVKTSLIGPGEIEYGKYKGRTSFDNIKPNSEQKIMYYSPSLGNFDIGKELSSLSMVDLQTDAAKQIAEDAALAYGGEFMDKVGDAYKTGKAVKNEKAALSALQKYFKSNPGKYNPEEALRYIKALNAAGSEAENLDLIAKAYSLYKGGYDLSKIPKTTSDLRDDIKAAASVEDVSSKKTWTESAAETGVTGINILQTGVGILTFLPNKIPVIGKASAGLQTAFSAATNIWKANLKYIAKDEKIARAEERYFPAMVLITAEDESGWQITKGYMIQIAYHEI